MPQIMLALMRQRAKAFMNDYLNLTHTLFFEEGERRSFHNGEYGTYRERLVRRLLGSFLSKQFSMGEGFLITADSRRSKQTDIVVFDTRECPEIEDLETRRFYPVECVYAAGSVKSKLDGSKLKTALSDLMETKFLRSAEPPNRRPVNPNAKPLLPNHNLMSHPWNPRLFENQNIVTFLVCESISDLNSEDFSRFAEGQYEPSMEGIPKRHNMILSLTDGYISYSFVPKSADGDGPRDQNGNYIRTPYPFPSRYVVADNWEVSTGHRWVHASQEGDHVIQFVHDLALALDMTWAFPFDAASYLPQAEQTYAPMAR